MDGWSAHGSKAAFQTDRARQNRLIGAGYRVLRFTWEDVNRREDYLVQQIIRALAQTPVHSRANLSAPRQAGGQ